MAPGGLHGAWVYAMHGTMGGAWCLVVRICLVFCFCLIIGCNLLVVAYVMIYDHVCDNCKICMPQLYHHYKNSKID
jgi:hypothetical protein